MIPCLDSLSCVIGWTIIVLVGLLGAVVLWKIFTGKIDLSTILNDHTGKASLSRLQFLIFTFVIALTLFLVIVGNGAPKFPPDIPAGIFALLGISAGTFAVSKGVDANQKVGEANASAAKTQAEASKITAEAALVQAKK